MQYTIHSLFSDIFLRFSVFSLLYPVSRLLSSVSCLLFSIKRKPETGTQNKLYEFLRTNLSADYNKQTQFTNCPFKLNLFIDNDLYNFHQSHKSQIQTQSNPIKANTNPIPERPKMNVSITLTEDYVDKTPPGFNKNKANSNPNKSKITNNQLRELAFKLLCAIILVLKSISERQTVVVAGISLNLRWELMKKTLFLISAALLINLIQICYAEDNPQPVHAGTRILQSGGLVVEVGDPGSPDCRWNQGLRFSPVANIIQVTLDGLEFCYAPASGGSLSFLGGLPMEFDIGQESFQPDPPGYNEGSNGSEFLKIGVGILRRNSSAYNFSSSYPVVELAQITTTWQRDRANFVQTLSGTANGYSCRFEEDVIVKNNSIILNYVLTNTGSKTFTTEQYLHNFLTFSYRNVGPDYRVYFPYDITASPQPELWQPPLYGHVGRAPGFIDLNPPMVSLENMVLYTKTISSVPKTWIYKPDDYLGPDTIAVEQSAIGRRVIIDSSLRSAYVGIWTTSYQVSPEQFIFITLAPGQHAEFTRTYKFSADGSMSQDCTGDRIINGNDLFALSSAWLSAPGSTNWNSSCDVSESADDFINFNDLAVLAEAWHQDANGPAPVAYWPMDETAGTLAADSMGSYDGSLVGFSEDNSYWVTGHSEGGLEFDGEDDYVEVEGFSGICGKNPRAIFAWIKTNGITSDNLPIISWGQKQQGGYWLMEVDEDQRLRLSCESGFISANQQQVGDDNWHHIAVVLDPVDSARPLISDVLLYVDGRRRTIYKMQEAQINTGCIENVRIGATHEPDSNTFAGVIDEVAIFNAAVRPGAVWQAYMK
jgi:hypothetical protein